MAGERGGMCVHLVLLLSDYPLILLGIGVSVVKMHVEERSLSEWLVVLLLVGFCVTFSGSGTTRPRVRGEVVSLS